MLKKVVKAEHSTLKIVGKCGEKNGTENFNIEEKNEMY
jgi:hypothetical protein